MHSGVPRVNRGDTPEDGWIHPKVGIPLCLIFSRELLRSLIDNPIKLQKSISSKLINKSLCSITYCIYFGATISITSNFSRTQCPLMHFTCISGDIKPEDLRTNIRVTFQWKTGISL